MTISININCSSHTCDTRRYENGWSDNHFMKIELRGKWFDEDDASDASIDSLFGLRTTRDCRRVREKFLFIFFTWRQHRRTNEFHISFFSPFFDMDHVLPYSRSFAHSFVRSFHSTKEEISVRLNRTKRRKEINWWEISSHRSVNNIDMKSVNLRLP